jgi:Uma2 family endonuclease
MTAALQLPSLLDDLTLLENKEDWTVDDLANLPKDLRYELIDGRLILPSRTFFHQRICMELAYMLRPHCPPEYDVVIDVSLEVDYRNEPRPDVVVARKSLGLRSPAPIEGALLLIEVVSPSSHNRDMFAKAKLFAAAGVKHYWVVDPTFRGGIVLTSFRIGAGGEYDIDTSTNRLFTADSPFPITIDVPALTAILREYQQAQDGQ